MIDIAFLQRAAAAMEIEVDAALGRRFDRYAELLLAWNQKMNLTAITEPSDIVIKHFIDSLTAVKHLPEGAFSLIDIGSGAGFPGVPLAMLRSDCTLTLLDSQQKRLLFLEAVCREVGVPVTLLHARAEAGGQREELREQFDVATARAVANLPTLCEYCLPYVRCGGRFIALKGPDVEKEMDRAVFAMHLMGGHLRRTDTLSLPPDKNGDCGERRLIFIDKIHPTPSKFPRPSAKIAKMPL